MLQRLLSVSLVTCVLYNTSCGNASPWYGSFWYFNFFYFDLIYGLILKPTSKQINQKMVFRKSGLHVWWNRTFFECIRPDRLRFKIFNCEPLLVQNWNLKPLTLIIDHHMVYGRMCFRPNHLNITPVLRIISYIEYYPCIISYIGIKLMVKLYQISSNSNV